MADTPNLEQYDIVSGSEAGAKLYLRDRKGKRTGEWIHLLGSDSKTYQERLAHYNRERLQRMQRGGAPIEFEETEEDFIHRLAICTKEWSFTVGDKKPFPCNRENAMNIYRTAPLIREQAWEFVHSRENFT